MKTTDDHNEPKLNIGGISEHGLKPDPLKTPDGYFDSLTPRIMERVRNSERPVNAGRPVWTNVLTPSIGLAAVALAAWFFVPPTVNDAPDLDTVLASLTVEELTTYADLEPAELVSYELVDYEQLANNENMLTEEDIIHYLETEEDIELNTIIDEIEI